MFNPLIFLALFPVPDCCFHRLR